jgi:hypothetical protein
MATKITPEVERPDVLPLETKPRRSGGWFRRLQRRVKLALAGDDEELLVENKTEVSWRVYHDYHLLGIVDAGEGQTYRLQKHGSLSVRPCADGNAVEYLVLPLTLRVRRVQIYRRHVGKEVEIYDMKAA